MKKAFRYWSWRGRKKDVVTATEIKSRADARKKGPFINEKDRFVYWVDWSKPTGPNKKRNRPYFRHYPNQQRRSVGKKVEAEIIQEITDLKSKNESETHRKARIELKDYIETQIAINKPIKWAFKDTDQSDFPLVGNLLANAISVKTHFHFKTPFGLEYEYDIAILGPIINKEPIILGVIELEKTHRFGYLKTLISKCLGFPLISIDISNLSVSDINYKWCEEAIIETTATSDDSLRRNYIYLHNFLYPIYLDIPERERGDNKHQFIIFSSNDSLRKLSKYIKAYANKLNLNSPDDFVLQPVNLNSNDLSSRNSFDNEGSIAGRNWQEINNSSFLRLTTITPTSKVGSLYLFHLVLARLINSHFNCLVGYKYARGIHNTNPEENLWFNRRTQNLIATKSLTEPTLTILEDMVKEGIIKKSDLILY